MVASITINNKLDVIMLDQYTFNKSKKIYTVGKLAKKLRGN